MFRCIRCGKLERSSFDFLNNHVCIECLTDEEREFVDGNYRIEGDRMRYSGYDIQAAIDCCKPKPEKRAELMIMYNIMLELKHISSKLDNINKELKVSNDG